MIHKEFDVKFRKHDGSMQKMRIYATGKKNAYSKVKKAWEIEGSVDVKEVISIIETGVEQVIMDFDG